MINIRQLPSVIIDKIHNYAYDCQSVGLTDQPCLANQIEVSSSNYLHDPIVQNNLQCCRNMNQMQPFSTLMLWIWKI